MRRAIIKYAAVAFVLALGALVLFPQRTQTTSASNNDENVNNLFAAVKSGKVVVSFDAQLIRSTAAASLGMFPNEAGKQTLTLVLRAPFDPERPLAQLTLVHEAKHYAQMETNQFPPSIFVSGRRLDTETEVRSLLLSEFDAYNAECDYAVARGLTTLSYFCMVREHEGRSAMLEKIAEVKAKGDRRPEIRRWFQNEVLAHRTLTSSNAR